jgi:anaerobic C4-dicarboxylate transporter DcuB
MIAVVSIFGIAWMSDTFVSANKASLVAGIKSMVQWAPWLPTPLLLGVMPACSAYFFFFCFYPSDLAAISMDRTGTTRIGKYLLNHSFMIPGLIGVGVSTAVGYALSRLYF